MFTLGNQLSKVVELNKEIEQISSELDTYLGKYVEVEDNEKTKKGRIILIDEEHGSITVEFDLGNDLGFPVRDLGFYGYNDLIIGKVQLVD